MSVSKNILLTTGANAAVGLLALISGPLAARLLGPAGRGELAAIQSLFYLAAVIALIGLPEATLYFVAKFPGRAREILKSALILVLAITPLVFAAAYRFAPLILRHQPAEVIFIARCSLGFIWVFDILALLQFAARGAGKIIVWNVARVLPILGWTVVLAGFALSRRPSVAGIAFGYLGVLGLCVVITLAMLRGALKRAPSPGQSFAMQMLKYGAPLACATVPQALNLRLDQVLISAFLPSAELGFYVVAVGWGGAVALVLTAIANLSFPRIAASRSVQEAAEIFTRNIRLGVTVSICLGSALVLITPIILPVIFGHAFRASIPAACLVVVASSLGGINIIGEEGLRGFGHTWPVFFIELSGITVTAGMLFWLLPKMGIAGAALASILGCFTASMTLGFYCWKKLRIRPSSLCSPAKQDVTDLWRAATSMLSRMSIDTGGPLKKPEIESAK
ncbi:MAG: oligosaccharide flippase family protein [Acidobacteriia bacterium]|nr:oligosaccharide flippase family protein [Terriglobia bacterium]